MIKIILYAEDDIDTAKLYKKKFENDYIVKWAENGLKALKVYEECSPDIILLDEMMPKMSGYEAAEKIRRKDKDTPIIFLSSIEDEKISIKCLKLGVIDFVRKSHERYEELLVKIQNAILNFPVRRNPIISITPDTTLNTQSLILTSFGNDNRLQFRESDLLRILLLNEGVLVKRELLLSQVWPGTETENAKDYLNKNISRLRKVMSDDKRIQIITNRGDGIVLSIGD